MFMLDLESGVRYDVVVLAGTRTGFPAVDEDDWSWVSQLITAHQSPPPRKHCSHPVGYFGVVSVHLSLLFSSK